LFFNQTRARYNQGKFDVAGNMFAFAALKADGSITAWGDPASGGAGAPSGSGYTKIYSTVQPFIPS
jgi:hypothetical protein